jgi:hypothetical protein
MSKQLTITIHNIPSEELAKAWEYAQSEEMKKMGYHVEKADNISFDFNVTMRFKHSRTRTIKINNHENKGRISKLSTYGSCLIWDSCR